MLQLNMNSRLLMLTIIIITLYSFNFLVSSTTLALISTNYTSYTVNLDITSVSDFEDSFALLSDSLIFLEQDGIFVFDYYMCLLYSKNDLKWENNEGNREVFFLKLDQEHPDFEDVHKPEGW